MKKTRRRGSWRLQREAFWDTPSLRCFIKTCDIEVMDSYGEESGLGLSKGKECCGPVLKVIASFLQHVCICV